MLNNPVNAIDPFGLINVTKTIVGGINVYRGIRAGQKGSANAIIGVVALGSGIGWPFALLETAMTAWNLGVAFPGLIKHGLKQIEEGLNESPCEISFGSWHNLRGLGPGLSFVDDPGETYKDWGVMKLEQAFAIRKKIYEGDYSGAAKSLVKWLHDFAM